MSVNMSWVKKGQQVRLVGLRQQGALQRRLITKHGPRLARVNWKDANTARFDALLAALNDKRAGQVEAHSMARSATRSQNAEIKASKRYIRLTRAALDDALELWRGDAYGEFAHESWARAEATRLTELRSGAIEDLAELLLDAGEWTAAIAAVQPLIDREPFRDRPRALLMRALADSGRRTDALREFQTYRVVLRDEVGTDPSDAIVRLDREIARAHDETSAG
jgi:tetratricopeptide (TPR) repeat protein